MTRGAVVTYAGSLIAEECCDCGITFAMPEDFRAYLHRKGPDKTFYCPNGHPQFYTDSIEAKLAAERDKRQKAEREVAFWQERTAEEQRANEKKQRQIRAMKRRAVAGVCQFCHRTFKDVVSHMGNRHPKESKQAGVRPQRGKPA